MKHSKPHLLVLLFISLLAGSCDLMFDFSSELYYSLDDPIPIRENEAIDAFCIVKYWVNNKYHTTVMRDQIDLDHFLYAILSEAERGNTIQMYTDIHSQPSRQKAFTSDNTPIDFTTPDRNQAKEWAKKMLLKGYKVSIVYNHKKKLYFCTAIQSK